MVQSLLESEQDVLAVARLAQLELGSPPHHVNAVLDKELDHVHQPQFPGLTVHDRKHDDAETDLKLRVLVEII